MVWSPPGGARGEGRRPGRASRSLTGSGCPARRSRRGPGRVDGPGVSRPPPDAGIWAPGRGMRGRHRPEPAPSPGPGSPRRTETGRGHRTETGVPASPWTPSSARGGARPARAGMPGAPGRSGAGTRERRGSRPRRPSRPSPSRPAHPAAPTNQRPPGLPAPASRPQPAPWPSRPPSVRPSASVWLSPAVCTPVSVLRLAGLGALGLLTRLGSPPQFPSRSLPVGVPAV